MIVCARCRHENPDGTVLCERCRTYLGWSRPTADAPGTASADGTGAPSSAPERGSGDAHEPAPEPPGQVPPVPEPRAPAPPAPAPHPGAPVAVRVTRGAPAPLDHPSPEPRAPRTPPPRTIGVRVADGPARVPPRPPPGLVAETHRSDFGAVRPGDSAGYDVVAERTEVHGAGERAAPVRTPDGAVRCPSCGRAVDQHRRFCRCGAALTGPPREASDVDDERKEPWHHRLRGGLRRGRAFWRRMREANQGVRTRFDVARSAQARLAQATAGLAALGITAVVVLPSAADVRAQVASRLGEADPRGFSALDVVAVRADPEPDPATVPADFVVAHAIDRTSGLAWATPWTDPVDAGAPCLRPGGAAALVLSLAGPSRVDRVSFLAGLPEHSPARAREPAPRVVDVSWGEGPDRCATFELDPGTALQSFALHARAVTEVRVVVVEVHPPQEAPAEGATPRVALSEVLLEVRGARPAG